MAWTYHPEALGHVLEAMGFDLDQDDGGAPGLSGSLTGRQERAGRSTVVTVDAGGRVRVTMTVMTDDQRRQPLRAGDAEFQVTAETVRTTIASGVLVDSGEFREAVAGIIAGLVEMEHEEEHPTRNRWSPPQRGG